MFLHADGFLELELPLTPAYNFLTEVFEQMNSVVKLTSNLYNIRWDEHLWLEPIYPKSKHSNFTNDLGKVGYVPNLQKYASQVTSEDIFSMKKKFTHLTYQNI